MSIQLEIFDLHFDVDPIGNADQVWELLASQQSGNAAYISVGNSVEPIFQLDPDEIQLSLYISRKFSRACISVRPRQISVEPISQLDPDEIQSLQGKRRRQAKDTWQGFC